jgi:hypothetical protein
MFPFKTKEFTFQTDLTVEELHERLTTRVRKWKALSIHTDGQLYGTINKCSAKIELGQSFQRNSFRPVVVFRWTNNNTKTEINGYYRVALPVLLTTLFVPLFGLYLSFKINNILPVVFLAVIWTSIYATLGRWLFYKDFKWVEEEFYRLVDQKACTQQVHLQ